MQQDVMPREGGVQLFLLQAICASGQPLQAGAADAERAGVAFEQIVLLEADQDVVGSREWTPRLPSDRAARCAC